jgi:hypothetical protein
MSTATVVANQIADAIFGGQSLTYPPATWYMGLLTAPPIADGTGFTEVAGGSYARVASVNDLANWPAASGGIKANGALISFPPATGGWGSVTHVGWFTAISGGLLRHWQALTVPRTVLNGDEVRFQAGDLVITIQ